eukprot:gene12979-13108_t
MRLALFISVIGLLVCVHAVEHIDSLAADVERNSLDSVDQAAISKALDDKEADDELLAALHNLPTRSLLASEAASAGVPGTPQCLGKYSSGQTYPRDCCESCKDCISTVQEFVNGTLSKLQTESVEVAQMFATKCYNYTTKEACDTTIASITQNIRVAKRAGQLCTALGACKPSITCQLSAKNTSEKPQDNSTASLDLCTVEGLVGGRSIFPAVNRTGRCASNAGCSAGAVCDMTSTVVSSTCSNGVDSSIPLGTCKAMCDLDSTKQELSRLNSLVKACSANADCAADQECATSDQCTQISCPTGTNSYVTTPCSKVCMAAIRNATAAKISEDGKTIFLSLSAKPLPATFACSDLFDLNTTALLGANAQCSAASTGGVVIQLLPESTISYGNNLVIKADQAVLKDLLVPTVKFSNGSVPVTKCDACAASTPTMLVLGPKVITLAATAEAATDVVIDASRTFDPTGRPLTNVTWASISDPASSSGWDQLLDTVNALSDVQKRLKLTIPASLLSSPTANFPSGVYTFKLTVTNWLGRLQESAPVSFTVEAACTAPVLSIIGGNSQSFLISQGIKLDSLLVASSVCPGKEVVYSWSTSSAAWNNTVVPDGFAGKTLIIPGPARAVQDGETRDVVLTAYLKGNQDKKVVIPITLTAVGTPLVAALKAPSGDVKNTTTIRLDASASSDPDDPNNDNPLVYTFSCAIVGSILPCVTGTLGTQAASGLWTIPVTQLAVDKQYKLTVTATKGSRTASASTTVKVIDGTLPIPTGKVIRQCGSTCPAKHSADQPLSLSLQLDKGYEAASISWSGPAGAAISGTSKDLTISNLPRTLGQQITVSAVLSLQGQNGTATITVPLNFPPYCSANSCFTAAAVKDGTGADKDTFPSAAFMLSLANVQDIGDGKLSYEFGVVTNGRNVPASVSDLASYTITGLPKGNSTVYGCAMDAEFARFCTSQTISVKEPAANFSAAAALDSVDVSQAASTGDVAALTKVALAVTNLADFVTTSSQSNSSTVNATAAAAAAAAAQAKVDAKAASIISSLASKVDARDPQAMQTVVTAVVSLGKASANMSAETKASVLSVTSAGITAIKSSKKPVSPSTASQLMTGLSLGGMKNSKAKSNGRSLLEDVAPTALDNLLSVLDPLSTITDLLGLSATPAVTYVPAGDMGLYTAVANQPGRALASLKLQAGVTADNMEVVNQTNAVVAFSGPFTGPCTTTDDAGVETTSQCADGVVQAAAQYFDDPAMYVDAKGAPMLTAVGLDAIVAGSGVVNVSVSGTAANGALPCSTENACSLNITVPLLSLPKANQTVHCLRVGGLPASISFAGYPNTSDYAVAKVLPASDSLPFGAATCQAKQGGAYLMAFATPTPRLAGVPESPAPVAAAPANTTAYNFVVTFQMDYTSLVSNSVLLETFKLAARVAMAKAAGLDVSYVLLKDLKQGSVIATFDINVPNTWSPQQINDMADTITKRPTSVFDQGFLTTYAITGVSATVTTPLPAKPAASNAMAMGLGIGLGVGGTLIIVAIVVTVMRRKAMGVEPRNSRNFDAEAPLNG